MVFPLVGPWMKEPNDLAALRINSAQVGSLVSVAVVTSERKILFTCGASVLTCGDVLDVKAIVWIVVLMNMAVFAPIRGAGADEISQRGVQIKQLDSWPGQRALWIGGRQLRTRS